MKLLIKIFITLFFIFEVKSNFYVNSIPKCGTHLATKCIELLTAKKPLGFYTDQLVKNGIPKLHYHNFLYGHMPYNQKTETQLKNLNYRSILILRDPRDQIISQIFWIKEKPSRDLGNAFKSKSFNQILDTLIENINLLYKSYLPWINNKSFCLIKFENLVGAKGNGNNKKQKHSIIRICNHLKIKYNKSLIDYTIKNLYGNSPTFRKGEISNWKKYFTHSQKERFKQVAGQLLIDLGYEKDLGW